MHEAIVAILMEIPDMKRSEANRAADRIIERMNADAKPSWSKQATAKAESSGAP